MRYFIRKSVLDLKEENRELYAKVNGTTDLLIVQDSVVEKLPVTIGDEEMVEIEIKVKSNSTYSAKGVF